MKFAKGTSGNPTGAARGKAHKLTTRVRELVNDKGGTIVEKILERAEGDDQAAYPLDFWKARTFEPARGSQWPAHASMSLRRWSRASPRR